MSCLDDFDHLLSFNSTSCRGGLQKLFHCISLTLCVFLLLFLHLLSRSFLASSINFCHFQSHILHLCCYQIQLYYSVFTSPSPPPIPLFNLSYDLIFCYCLSSHICAAILLIFCSPVNPSVTSPPLLPLLCTPDLLSLCLITKSTGSSRRSCRRSSPSVRSSLTRVRGISWHGALCVCVCVRVCLSVCVCLLVSRKLTSENATFVCLHLDSQDSRIVEDDLNMQYFSK